MVAMDGGVPARVATAATTKMSSATAGFIGNSLSLDGRISVPPVELGGDTDPSPMHAVADEPEGQPIVIG